MKRDMDLIRRLVLALDDHDDAGNPVVGLPSVDDRTFNYHAALLIEAGLAAGSQQDYMDGSGVVWLWRLTWAGHDFADAVRSDTIWKAALDNVIKPSASWTFGVLLEYLKQEIRTRIPGLV